MLSAREANWPDPLALRRQHPSMADIYTTVKMTGMSNALAARVQMPSALNLPVWQRMATGHPDDELVIHGVTSGFSLQYWGPKTPSDFKIYNHPSATAYPTHVSSYIAKEVEHGALIGPYTDLPFTWIHLSPLMTRQKSTDGRRIIVDLSYPGRDIRLLRLKERSMGECSLIDFQLQTN